MQTASSARVIRLFPPSSTGYKRYANRNGKLPERPLTTVMSMNTRGTRFGLCGALLLLGCGSSGAGGPVDSGVANVGDADGFVFSDSGMLIGSVHAPAKVVELAAASDHVCARLIDGRVFCWGALQYSVCDNTAGNSWPLPRLETAITDLGVAQMAIASPHCALSSTGKVWCWGSYLPQIVAAVGEDLSSDQDCSWDSCPSPDGGPDIFVSCSPPTAVPVASASAVATGMDHTCVLQPDGTVACWGDDSSLQSAPDVAWTSQFEMAHGGNDPPYLGTIRTVPNVTGAMAIASGTGTCALLSDATVTCWGGQTPPAAPGESSVSLQDYAPPVRPIPLDQVAQVTVGDYVGFALRADGSVFEFSFGPGSTPLTPFEVPDLKGASQLFATPWDDIPYSSGMRAGQYVAALFPDGTVRIDDAEITDIVRDDGGAPSIGPDGGFVTIESNPGSVVPSGPLEGVSGARLVAASELVLCIVVGDDEVRCMGDNSFGQLGRSTVGGSREPLAPVIWPPIMQMAQ